MVVLQKVQQTMLQLKKNLQGFHLHQVGSYTLNYLTPRRYFTLHQHVPYGEGTRHYLDIYHAVQPLPHRPLIVFAHGGAWQYGDKNDYVFVGEAFAREGYDVAVLNYHLAPEHVFPAYVDDLATALNFLHSHQDELQISTEHLILMGHSAGAFNIMSVLYHPQQYALQCFANIKAAIGIAGPYHFDYKGDPLAGVAFSDDVPYQQVMPNYFVQPNQVRHLLLRAANDELVHDSNCHDLAAALQQAGNHYEVRVIPKTTHITIVASLASLLSRGFQTKDEILKFLTQD